MRRYYDPVVELIRVKHDSDGTFGVLVFPDAPVFVTLEPQWKDNEKNISCIPEGEYKCVRYNSPTYGETFMVTDVYGRSYILFHWGNTENDTEGCIILGYEFGKLGIKDAVLNSKAAFREFMQRLEGYNSFLLRVS